MKKHFLKNYIIPVLAAAMICSSPAAAFADTVVSDAPEAVSAVDNSGAPPAETSASSSASASATSSSTASSGSSASTASDNSSAVVISDGPENAAASSGGSAPEASGAALSSTQESTAAAGSGTAQTSAAEASSSTGTRSTTVVDQASADGNVSYGDAPPSDAAASQSSQTAETTAAETQAAVPGETESSVTASDGPSANGVTDTVQPAAEQGPASVSGSSLALDFTLVSPTVRKSDAISVAEGGIKLSDGSWVSIGREQNIRFPYYKLIRTENDSNGTQWYVCAAHASRIGDYSAGEMVTELWLKASDCRAQNSISIDTSDAKRASIVKTALSLLGKQYSYAGSGPDSFDCSGFVSYVMSQNGISVPRTSSSICALSGQISQSELKAGDIVGRSGHVGIYIGNGVFVHASEATTGVVAESLSVYNTSGRSFTNFINVVGN